MTVTLIGSKGLIGSALKIKLNDLNQMTNCLDFAWDKADLYLEDKIDLSNFMVKFQNLKILQMLSNSKHIIISLGIVHVSSTQSQVDVELRLLKKIIRDIFVHIKDGSNVFLISSGGGIFNSSRIIRHETDLDFIKTPYAQMKLELENDIKNISKNKNFNVLRLPNVYGDQQNPNKNQGLLFKIAQCHSTNSELKLTKHILSEKQYIHNNDVAYGISKLLLNSDTSLGNIGDIVHLVQPESIFSIQDLITMSEEIWQKPLFIYSEENLPYDTVIMGTKYPELILPQNQNGPDNYLKKIREKHG